MNAAEEALKEVGKRTRRVCPAISDADKQRAFNYIMSLLSAEIPLHSNEITALVSIALTTDKKTINGRFISLMNSPDRNAKQRAIMEITKPNWYTRDGVRKKHLKELREWQQKLFKTPVIVGGKDGG